MKSLTDFITERAHLNESSSSKTITFNFKGLENEEETLKSLEEQSYCTVDDKKLTITVSADNYDKLDTVQDILQQYADTLMKSEQRAAHEDYAQKTRSFANKVNELNDAIDEFANPEEPEEDKDEKKEDE